MDIGSVSIFHPKRSSKEDRFCWQTAANNRVYQRYAGLFHFQTMAKAGTRKQSVKVLKRGTWVRAAEMHHANGDNAPNGRGATRIHEPHEKQPQCRDNEKNLLHGIFSVPKMRSQFMPRIHYSPTCISKISCRSKSSQYCSANALTYCQ